MAVAERLPSLRLPSLAPYILHPTSCVAYVVYIVYVVYMYVVYMLHRTAYSA